MLFSSTSEDQIWRPGSKVANDPSNFSREYYGHGKLHGSKHEETGYLALRRSQLEGAIAEVSRGTRWSGLCAKSAKG